MNAFEEESLVKDESTGSYPECPELGPAIGDSTSAELAARISIVRAAIPAGMAIA
jgi:hypothetical protein